MTPGAAAPGDEPVGAEGRRESGGHGSGHGTRHGTEHDVDGASGEEGTSGEEGEEKSKARSFWRELPILIGVAVVLALLIKTFLVQAFSIPSDSMQDTLQRGDRVLVDKLTPWFDGTAERGEVVVFHDPGGWLGETPDEGGISSAIQYGLSRIGLMPSAEEQDLIKRVIAVGGDTVACEGNGPVTVNGVPLDESEYLFPGNTPCGDQDFGPVEVPEGRLWVMGDHRQNSLDSRYHQDLPGGGTVPEEQVVGRAIVVAWPVTRWSTLPIPSAFEEVGSAAVAAAPAALGLAGAVSLVLWQRRRPLPREEGEPRG